MIEDRERATPVRALGRVLREEWGGLGFTLLMLLSLAAGVGWLALSLF